MAKTYYLPHSDRDRAHWLRNFSTKFPGYVTTFGFTAADATAVGNDNASFNYQLDIIELFKTETRERTTYKDILRNGPLSTPFSAQPTLPVIPAPPPAVAAGIFPRMAAIVKRIKAHPAYTESIGKDLGIIGSETVTDFFAQQPVLSIFREAGTIVIKYTRGKNHGIQLYCKRGGEEDHTLLSVVNLSTYRDVRPNLVAGQPETRHYEAWFVQNDKRVGQVSPGVSILV